MLNTWFYLCMFELLRNLLVISLMISVPLTILIVLIVSWWFVFVHLFQVWCMFIYLCLITGILSLLLHVFPRYFLYCAVGHTALYWYYAMCISIRFHWLLLNFETHHSTWYFHLSQDNYLDNGVFQFYSVKFSYFIFSPILVCSGTTLSLKVSLFWGSFPVCSTNMYYKCC